MKVFTVEAVNPETVCDPHALLATALLSIGVPQAPRLGFNILHDEIGGNPIVRWRWHFLDKTADGVYLTKNLLRWWKDSAWIAANPTHEWAISRAIANNMEKVAAAVRTAIPRMVVRHGKLEAHIPINATEEQRQWAIDKLEGRLPAGTPLSYCVACQRRLNLDDIMSLITAAEREQILNAEFLREPTPGLRIFSSGIRHLAEVLGLSAFTPKKADVLTAKEAHLEEVCFAYLLDARHSIEQIQLVAAQGPAFLRSAELEKYAFEASDLLMHAVSIELAHYRKARAALAYRIEEKPDPPAKESPKGN